MDIFAIACDLTALQKKVWEETHPTGCHTEGGGGNPVTLSRGQQTRRQSELETGLPHTPCFDDPRIQEQDIKNGMPESEEDATETL